MITEQIPLSTKLNDFEERIKRLEKEVEELKKMKTPTFMHNSETGETVPLTPEAEGEFSKIFQHVDALFKKVFG